MSKPVFGNDGDVRLARGHRQIDVATEGDTHNHEPQRGTRKNKEQSVCDSIENFVADDMGFLKVRRGLDTDEVHLTWTFANGKHYGHYVYVSVRYWQLSYGLQILIQKRDEVYTGLRVPTPDKRYPRHD